MRDTILKNAGAVVLAALIVGAVSPAVFSDSSSVNAPPSNNSGKASFMALPSPAQSASPEGNTIIHYRLNSARRANPPSDAGASQPINSGENTYAVKKHDTLWDIAFSFFKNAFRWPDIWHANPSVQNPNLIYPGTVLTIPGSSSASAAAPAGQDLSDKPAQTLNSTEYDLQSRPKPYETSSLSPIDQESPAQLSTKLVGAAADSEPPLVLAVEINSLIEKGYYSSEFLAAAPFVAATAGQRERFYPKGSTLIDNSGAIGTYKPFDEIVFKNAGGGACTPGDTLDVIGAYGSISIKGESHGIILRRLGWGLAAKTDGKSITVRLEKVWDIFPKNVRLSKHTAFPDRQVDTLLAADRIVSGHIARRLTTGPVLAPYEMVIADIGANDGVALGDIFSVNTTSDSKERPLAAIACVINVGERFSSLAIIKMFSANIGAHASISTILNTRFK
ncbi:MAG: LysM peptidoglycan-binding domain-containing protein [Chitinivibrionales bacterium]|nr:LysM peptidoglycan-binding domain-containing protein [Chitinivibrionales bacterium]